MGRPRAGRGADHARGDHTLKRSARKRPSSSQAIPNANGTISSSSAIGELSENAAFRAFLREAANKRVRIAAASQAAALAPDALVARTTDDVPLWTRNLLAELNQ